MVSKGQFVGLDWNRITWLHSQVMTHKLTLAYRRIGMAFLNCIGMKSYHIPFTFTTGNLIGV